MEGTSLFTNVASKHRVCLCVLRVDPAPVWYENLSGVVICPDNSNININGVVIGSRDQ